ncbi:hypothetical protein [Hyphomonas sp.]|uniref:hypothetical protein n=1 Tax=Hyphomonas sp. TaxID=87 RepID=UPI003919D112
MPPAFYSIAFVLGIVSAVSYAYAGYMFTQGQSETATPVILTATLTLALIPILGLVMRKKKE